MTETKVDLSKYRNTLSRQNQMVRFIWSVVWTLLARPFPRRMASGWKRFLLRLFSAKIDSTATIYSSAKIYYPSNLTMGANSCLASNVICYNVDKITIKDNVTVSQGSFLCTASHDISSHLMPLITAPIIIDDQAWIAADAFIGMGVTIGQGAVVGARAVVTASIEPWSVVVGNPARTIKKRIIKDKPQC